MLTRRDAIRLLSSTTAGAFLMQAGLNVSLAHWLSASEADPTPPLSPGAPKSPERMALIEAFGKQADGLEKKFMAHSYKGDWTMPYRLFQPESKSKLPLVVYLHGSGGLGDDNQKQLELGNVFGTRVWLLPENQKRFPCYVVAPQTDRGWAKYEFTPGSDRPRVVAGLGDGSKMALNVIDSLRRELSIDDGRIYVAGQSMGGVGVWNIIAGRPNFFAAAIPCCGSASPDDGTESIQTPLWAFHGEADQTVPVSITRDRIAARRKAGGHPLYTEYAGVDHNVWEWAFTEPELVRWVFAQTKA